jgi:hypothetical protein
MRPIAVLMLALAAGACAAPRSTDSPDVREALTLAPVERDLVLAEMRRFVLAIRAILEGVADNDMKNVAAAARAAGLEAHRAQIKVPPRYRALSLATHEAFDEIALHAQQPGGRDRVLTALADNLNRCVACHALYRFPE